jgi:hypothetical protein
MARAQKKEALKSLKAAQDERRQAAADLIEGTPDLSPFGVTKEDEELFGHYEALVRPARLRMRQYWHELWTVRCSTGGAVRTLSRSTVTTFS